MPEPRPAAEPPKTSKRSVLAARTLSTVGLWIFIAAAMATGQPVLLYALLIAVGTLACAELLGLLDLRGTPGWGAACGVTVACAALHLFAVSAVSHGALDHRIELIAAPLLIVAVTCALLCHPIEPRRTRDQFTGAIFAFAYTAGLTGFIARVIGVGGEGSGALYLLFLLAVTKFSDMGAYIVGTLIGKHKFIPHISPGKTWEGIALGAFPFSIGAAALIYGLFGKSMPALSWGPALVIAVVLCALAIIGDLAESVIKRALARKDSGAALPGIGGVLDLVDSVLFTAPAFYFYLAFVTK